MTDCIRKKVLLSRGASLQEELMEPVSALISTLPAEMFLLAALGFEGIDGSLTPSETDFAEDCWSATAAQAPRSNSANRVFRGPRAVGENWLHIERARLVLVC